MIRKGMTKGSGRKGYYNLIGNDPRVHSMSAKGMKQPQKTFNLGDKVISRFTKAKGTVISKQPFAVEYEYQNKKYAKLDNPTYWQKGGKSIKQYLNDAHPELSKRQIDLIYNDYLKEDKLNNLNWQITQKKFRNKKTGEIVTQVPILDINDYEEVKGGKLGRKDYEAFAEIMASEKDSHNLQIEKKIVDYFQEDNPNFQKDRFYKAVEKYAKGGKLIKGRVLPSYKQYVKKHRIRKGTNYFQGDRIKKGNLSNERWELARKIDNKRIGKKYESWEKSKFQRWK